MLNQEETLVLGKNARRCALVLNNTGITEHTTVVEDDEGNAWTCKFELTERAPVEEAEDGTQPE